MAELIPLLRRRYAQVAKDLLGPLIDVLNTGRVVSGGDLDKLLIVLVVAMRTAEDRRVLALDLDQVLSGAVTQYPSLSTNVRSIADSTGVPKESVRRKVAALVAAGWIQRDGTSLALTPQASRMLTAFREDLFRAAVRYHQVAATLEAQAKQDG